MKQSFAPGERVRAIYAVGGIRAGSRGTVVQAFACAPLYDVTFEGSNLPHLVMHYKLVPDLPEPASTAHAQRSPR